MGLKQEQFIQKMARPCQESCAGTPLFPSVKLAQLALETGWGKTIEDTANACFGIKATSRWLGKVISFTTKETINGVSKTFTGTGQIYDNYTSAIQAGANRTTLFRAYDSIEQSISDHSRLLLNSPTYEKVRQATTPEAQCTALKQCGYATAQDYDTVLIQIIHGYQLNKFD